VCKAKPTVNDENIKKRIAEINNGILIEVKTSIVCSKFIP
jgi:hypothetical protein